MLTRYHAILKRAGGLLMALSAALAFCSLTGTNARAQAAPPNNNVTNAEGIVGSTGSVFGTNLYVVAQTNAPAGDPFPAEYSVWYEWTAPFTSMMDFNTRNSTDANGNPLDTVLVVYALKSGTTNVAWTNLTAVASNDDDSNTNWGVASRVSFQAALSQMYVIQVDGSQKSTSGTNAQGYVSLNWLPSLQGGGFGFSASYFPVGSLDDYIEYNDAAGSITPSIYGHTAGSPNERITVTRTGGFSGRCQVTLILTNSFYTNIYYSEAIGSNVLVTNYADATLRTVLSYTNIYETNLISQDFYANDYNGTIEYLPLDELIFASQTNTSVNPFGLVNAYSEPLGTFGLVNFLTNFPCAGTYSSTSGPISNSDGSYTVAITNVFCTNFVTNVGVPAAFAGIHYTGYSNTLTFDDFQMSQDVYVQVDPVLANYPAETSPLDCAVPGPEDYYYLVNCSNATFLKSDPAHIYTGLNASAQLILTNVVLDPTDNQDIIPPTIVQPTADLNILNYWGNPNPLYTNVGSQVVINFERETFRVNRNAGTATLWVQRYPRANAGGYTCHYTIDTQYGSEGLAVLNWNDWTPVAGADYAVPSEGQAVYDFTLPTDASWGGLSGTLTFPAAPNIAPQPIQIPIVNNGSEEFDEDIYVELYQTDSDYQSDTAASPPGYLGNIQNVHLTINFDNTSDNVQPGGALDRNWNIDNQPGSQPPDNSTPGATGGAGAEVNAVVVQPNDESIIGGYFDSYNQVNVYNIARLKANGFQDTSFATGTGINNGFVSALALDSAGRVIVGGTFSSYNSANTSSNIFRLLANGAYDPSFVAGVGFNGPVQALWIDANGNILVAGNFTQYNTTNVNNIVRLLPTGGLDTNFYPNLGNGLPNYGTDLPINAVTTDHNQNIFIGGEFQNVNGVPVNYIARLLPNGTLDTTFNPGVGPDDEVNAIAVTTNNEVLIGGDFQNYQLNSRNYVALVNTNGVLDASFTTGTGADAPVYSALIQPDGNALIGGSFTSYNGSRRIGLARLLPQGWLDTTFMDTSYNQFAGLVNDRAIDQPNSALAMALEPTGNIMVGGIFSQVGGGSLRDDLHPRENIVRVIGAATAGPETGGLGNSPGNVTFTQNPYNVLDTSGRLFITLQRTNGSLGPVAVTLGTNTYAPGPGDATAADYGLDLAAPLYEEVWDQFKNGTEFPYGWRRSDGFYGFNNAIGPAGDNADSAAEVYIYNDLTAQQNLLAGLSLLDINSYGHLNLGGVPIPTAPAYGTPSSQLNILNNNLPLGVVGFSANNYTTVDTTNSVTITVVRTNGSSGAISINYSTANGTARIGGTSPQYFAASGTLNFPVGITTETFKVQIGQFNTVQGTTFFRVNLSIPSTNSIIDTNILPTTATVTIIDGNFVPGHLDFSPTNYLVLKGGVATVGVQRIGGAVGVLQVQCGTSDGTGINGLNYVGVTNTLVWSNQDVSTKTMTIQTLQDSTVEGTKTVNVSLFNATNIGSSATSAQILTAPSTATVDILDSDSYGSIGFASPNFNILMNAGQALVTVIRTNGITGTVQVGFATFNDTNTILPYQPAYAGTNYGQTNGTLVFGPNVTSQSFIVPVYNTGNGEASYANREVALELFAISNSPAANSNQFPIFATLTILDTNLVLGAAGSIDLTTQNGKGFDNTVYSLALQPDGSILAGGAFSTFNDYPFNNVARLQPVGQYDTTFLNDLAGPNSNVLQILSQPLGTNHNGPILIAGAFSQVNGVNRNGIARLNVTGSLDESFNPGSAADGTVYSIAGTLVPTIFGGNLTNLVYSQAYYLGGAFANFDGIPSGGITRLNAATNSPGLQGTVDTTFNPGQGVTSASAAVRVVAVEPNNQVVAGGDFTAFNGQTNNHLVRLNPDGSVDTSFNPSTGSDPSQSVRAMVVQPDGKILIGGSFTNVNGSGYNYLARLNADGSVDTNFNVGLGANNAVLTLALDSQERILVGGQFSRFSGVTRAGITRLNPDGTVDPTINFGSAADGGFIESIVIQTNDEIDIGGGFTTFEGVPENDFVRVYGGANYGDGAIQFTTSQYGVSQNSTNVVILLQRLGGEGTLAQPTVSVVFSTSDGTAQAGVDYVGVTNTVTFPYGETFETVTVPLINNILIGSDKYFNLNLSSPLYATIGSEYPSAIVTVSNVNTAVSYSAPTYRQTANAPSSNAIIPITRLGDLNSTFSITVYTGTNGTATPYTNYIPTTNVLTFNPGISNLSFLVPVLNATNQFGDVTVDLEMANPSNVFIGSPSSATLTIASVLKGPGYLAFSQTNYFVSEGATNAYITIVRTNGSSGSVSVVLTTSNDTAVAGLNYLPVSITNTFADGSSTPQVVAIPVIQLPAAGPDTTVYLTLSNPTGGAIIGGTNVEILTIQNDYEDFFITNSPYFVGEGTGSVTVDVVRSGPVSNTAAVNYATFTPPNVTEAEGYALPGIDYVPNSGTLVFNSNVTFETVPITILQGATVNGPLTFQMVLSSPTNLSSTDTNIQLGVPSAAPITILSDVTAFELATNAYSVAESGSNLVVTVNRVSGTNSASVQFATSDGTAVNQVDYIATNGTLVFNNGVITNSFTIPIINQNIVENNKTFNVFISNPKVLTIPSPATNAYVLSPSNATVTISNVLTGVSFSSASYTVSECAATVSIPVILTGATNNLVSVQYATSDGSGHTGVNYFGQSGFLTFEPGQTETNLTIQLINNHIIGPDHTVILTLSGVQNAELLNPSTSVLTIQECNGAFIVKSGTSFVSGTFPGNVPATSGVLFSNETVTMLFGLRDIAGISTTNLVATLLATNGVTNVSGPQGYGAMAVGGPTVARPFSFTITGTNGQTIVANFTLKDGSQVYSNVAFGFTLGGNTSVYSTNEILQIVGQQNYPSMAFNNNPPNFGYPSTITVAGIVGEVTSVATTISDFGHQFPKDVAMLLVSPTGQASYLMSHCGGDLSVNHLNLTFSETASIPLPDNGLITSGTYLPTVIGFPPGFPANSSGKPTPPLPSVFKTNLNTFVGNSPNGNWSLFVADEDNLDNGYISNGWSLTIGTGIPVEQDSDLEMTMTAVPTAPTLSNTLVYIINVTNYGPSAATNILITDTLPVGATYVTNNCNCAVGTNGVMTFTAPSLAVSNGVSFTVTVVPSALGYITNIAAATADQPNPNSNNVQTNVLLVTPESADLGVTLSSAPNPVLDGASVSYTIVVTNNGPSFATAVSAVDVLPVGFVPSSITPSAGATFMTNDSIVSITWNLGALQANATATLSIVAGVNLPEGGLPSVTNLDSVTVSSQVYDPAKLNNYAAVKTQVEPTMLTLMNSNSKLMLTWPVTSGLILQGATNLPASPTSPQWVSITNSTYVLQQLVEGQMKSTYSLPGNTGFRFFRLKSQLSQIH